jgi:hypothetical protein
MGTFFSFLGVVVFLGVFVYGLIKLAQWWVSKLEDGNE